MSTSVFSPKPPPANVRAAYIPAFTCEQMAAVLGDRYGCTVTAAELRFWMVIGLTRPDGEHVRLEQVYFGDRWRTTLVFLLDFAREIRSCPDNLEHVNHTRNRAAYVAALSATAPLLAVDALESIAAMRIGHQGEPVTQIRRANSWN